MESLHTKDCNHSKVSSRKIQIWMNQLMKSPKVSIRNFVMILKFPVESLKVSSRKIQKMIRRLIEFSRFRVETLKVPNRKF